MYCTNTNLLAMTVDRYIATARPLRYIALMTREAILGLVATAWVASFLLLCLPAIFTYHENPSYTMFVEISRVVIFQVFPLLAFVGVTCHLLHLAHKRARETRDLVAHVRFNHASEEVNSSTAEYRQERYNDHGATDHHGFQHHLPGRKLPVHLFPDQHVSFCWCPEEDGLAYSDRQRGSESDCVRLCQERY